MKKVNVIGAKEVNIGTKLIVKDGRTATIQEFVEKLVPTHYELMGFDTDIGYVEVDEIKRICKK